MINKVATVDFLETPNEVEALLGGYPALMAA